MDAELGLGSSCNVAPSINVRAFVVAPEPAYCGMFSQRVVHSATCTIFSVACTVAWLPPVLVSYNQFHMVNAGYRNVSMIECIRTCAEMLLAHVVADNDSWPNVMSFPWRTAWVAPA
jgi:hypothetical protein